MRRKVPETYSHQKRKQGDIRRPCDLSSVHRADADVFRAIGVPIAQRGLGRVSRVRAAAASIKQAQVVLRGRGNADRYGSMTGLDCGRPGNPSERAVMGAVNALPGSLPYKLSNSAITPPTPATAPARCPRDLTERAACCGRMSGGGGRYRVVLNSAAWLITQRSQVQMLPPLQKCRSEARR